MCGIAGYFGIQDIKLLKNMLKVLKHRGPNGEGFYLDSNVALGNRRLAIIDIKGGNQPIHNEDKTIWITYNGEIYNFLELNEELKRRGHKFYTKTDTETIVHAYEEWGTKCLRKLNGMFAFAIWDKRKKQLFLARDRFGIKPLYYYRDGKKLIFASEIKAILQYKKVPRIPNDKIIYQYLIDGVHDHTEETFFFGIKKLLPAHYMVVNKGRLKIEKYWDLKKINSNIDEKLDDKKIVKDFYNILEDSIKKHLISDVPIGTCLSGGIDSSTIVCIVNKFLREDEKFKKILGKRQKAFSAVYNYPKVDERNYIKEVVNFTKIEKNFVYPNSEKLWKDLRKFVYYQEEPVANTSPFSQWFVMKLASKKVKVLLDGQGGDELFAGYIPYFLVYFRDLIKRKKYFNFIKELVLSLDLTVPLIKKFLSQKNKEEFVKSLLKEKFVSENEKFREKKWEYKSLAKKLYLDVFKYSLPKLLRYEDKNSSAFSIEARVPYLDYRISEFAFSLPLNQKIRNGWTKHIMREALRGVIPEKIRLRRSKLGFPTPEADWIKKLSKKIIREFSVRNVIEENYFNNEKILEEFKRFVNNKLDGDYSDIFWRILNLKIWFRIFFNKNQIQYLKF